MIGVIADDLTGAAELAAVGARHGLRAEVVIAGDPGGNAGLVCIDTDSRSCSPVEAASRASQAALLLKQSGARWIYKKTDSVLRGNVTPELEAIVGQLRLDGALLVPANPSLGRTIVDGQYFIGEKPIHETEFARDPRHPRSSPNVLELLARPTSLALCLGRLGTVLPGQAIVIGHAASPADLYCWAAEAPKNWLMAGGAEFFAALLGPETPAQSSYLSKGKELFVCGSASDATRAFVASQKQNGVPVFRLPDEVATTGVLGNPEFPKLVGQIAAALRANSRVILHVGLPVVEVVPIAEMLALELVRVAEVVLRNVLVSQVYTEGGATAVALARAMDWKRLAVSAELAPGVVALSAQGIRAQYFIVKPGSYRWPDSLARLNEASPASCEKPSTG